MSWSGSARCQKAKNFAFVSGKMILSVFFPFSKQQKDKVGIHNEVSLSLKGTGACDSHCLVSGCSSPSLLLGLSDQRHTTLLNAWMEDLLAHECGAVWRIWPLLDCWSMHTYMLTPYAMLSDNSCDLCVFGLWFKIAEYTVLKTGYYSKYIKTAF